jgi:hypothetical protein
MSDEEKRKPTGAAKVESVRSNEENDDAEEAQAMSQEEEIAAYDSLINPGAARFMYEISLKTLVGVDVYLLRVPFHTYAPLEVEGMQALWELIKGHFTAGTSDRADVAQAMIEAGETDYRLILDKADIAFQWLSEEEQRAAINTVRNTVTARRAKEVRKRNSSKGDASKQAKRR